MEKNVNTRTYKKLGFTSMEAVEIIEPLNVLLANYHVYYQKMRSFHWNITGRNFFELHEKFEEIYNEANVNIDAIAERIRVFGQTPVCTLKEYLSISEIEEVSPGMNSMQMIQETLKDMQMLLSFMVDVTDAAINMGDVGTEDMINSFINKMETNHWMLTAWLKNN